MNTSQHMYVRKASAGTGKTFTLAAHYIALLLQHEHYQSILAVTFTNKATAEMKDRIIAYLYAIAHHIEEESTQRFLGRVREISTELELDTDRLTDAYCQQTAEALHKDLLIRYDEMRVQTIDAFLQGLLAGMVQQLDGAVGYQVELDTQRIISDAVDGLLTEGAQDSTIRQHLTAYINDKMGDGKNWDVRKGLIEIGSELYTESIQANQSSIMLDEKRLYAFKQEIDWRKHAPLSAFAQALQAASRWQAEDFAYGKDDVVAKVRDMTRQVHGEIADDNKAFAGFGTRLLKGMGIMFDDQGKEQVEPIYTAYKGSEPPSAIQAEILQLQHYAQSCRHDYIRDKWRTRFIHDLVLMGALQERINQHLARTNTRLLATTAKTLYKALREGDADFILEKAGIRYRHIMLDEFQDTSSLQWENFKKLILEILSSTHGSTLIVGDIKQSIYRWRNGNWEIMDHLPAEWPKHYTEPPSRLVRNFRSHREVVRFNLDTMYMLTQETDDARMDDRVRSIYDEGYLADGSNLEDYYLQKKEGGYVQVRCYAMPSDLKQAHLRHQVRRNILLDMFAQIEHLLSMGIAASDIMILIRRRKEATEVLEALQDTKDDYPLLGQTTILSPDCFQLQFSPLVSLLVCAIRYIYIDDAPSLEYVHLFAPKFAIESRRAALRAMALTDLVELLIQECILSTGQEITDLSYLNSFRDKIRQFVLGNGGDGAYFLRYWDDKMCQETIPAVNSPGIRLMTIHASKGLEADNVFIPFCDWKMEEDKQTDKLWCAVPELVADNDQEFLLPIPQNSITPEAGFGKEYTYEHFMQRIDNLNLLYVAITRAAQRLYIYSDVETTQDSATKRTKAAQKWNVGQLLAKRCGLLAELETMIKDKQFGQTDQFAECQYGDSQWQSPAKIASIDQDPLSYQSAMLLASQCYSSDAHIAFRQSQDSRKFGWNIADLQTDALTLEQTALGTICHDVLASLRLYPNVADAVEAAERAVDKAYRLGTIPTIDMRDKILPLVTQTVSSLSQWFTGDWYVQCEETILLRNEMHDIEERRMDRVMWSRDRTRAIVLDYKFGQDNLKYDRQVRRYMDICRRMGAQSVEGYLWIAAESRLITITQ